MHELISNIIVFIATVLGALIGLRLGLRDLQKKWDKQ